MSRKEARSVVVMMELDQNLFPSTASFGASVSIINIDVDVAINDHHHHLRGEGWGVFMTGRACNDCNGSTICIYIS